MIAVLNQLQRPEFSHIHQEPMPMDTSMAPINMPDHNPGPSHYMNQ